MEIQQLQVRITAETRQLNNSLNEIKRELGQIQYKNAANENSFRELNRQGSAQIKALEKSVADALAKSADSYTTFENKIKGVHYIDVDKAKAELNTFKSQFDLLTDQIEEKVQQAFSYKYIAGGYQETIEELMNLQYQYKQLEMDYNEYRAQLQMAPTSGVYQTTEAIMDMRRKLVTLKDEAADLERKLSLTDISTEEWNQLQKKAIDISAEIAKIENQIADANKALQQTPQNINKSTSATKQFGNSITNVLHQLQSIGGRFGAAFGTIANYVDMFRNLGTESQKSGEQGSGALDAIGGAASFAGGKIGIIIGIITIVLKLLGKIGSAIGGIMSKLKQLNPFRIAVRKIGAVLATFIRKARTAFIFTAINQAFIKIRNNIEALVYANNELITQLQYTRGAWLTAFQPIYEKVMPILISFLNYLEQLGYKVAMFLARLAGKSPEEFQAAAKRLWEQAQAYKGVGEAAEEANRQLAKFDELNILQDNKSNSSGNGDEDNALFRDLDNYGFKEYKTWGEWLEDFIDRLRTKVSKLATILTSAASKINTFFKKFKGMLDYNKNRESGIKLFEEIAKALNNFIEEIDTDAIGTAIGQFVRWVFEMLGKFFKTLNWKELGKKLAQFINSAFSSMDINTVFNTLVEYLNGLISMAGSFFDTLDTFGITRSITLALSRALSGINWQEVGRLLSSLITTWADLVATILSGWDWGAIATTLTNAFWTIMRSINWGQIAAVVIRNAFLGTISLLGGVIEWYLGQAFGAALATFKIDPEQFASFLMDAFKMPKDLQDKIKDSYTSPFQQIKLTIIYKITEMIAGVKEKLAEFAAMISDKFGNIKLSLKKVVENTVAVVIGIWGGIVTSIKTPLNNFIDVLNKFLLGVEMSIASMIYGFNATAAKLPGVPEIPMPSEDFFKQIPRLASGGIITKPTVAMMGEYVGASNNPEIAAPQKLIETIINSGNEELIDVMIQLGRQIVTAIGEKDLSVSIGDDVIAKSVKRANKANIARTGYALI